jgi:iron complex outermembrane recepter protein
MKKFLTLLTAVLSFAFVSHSQLSNVAANGNTPVKGKISGTVIDGNTKTIESATISLQRAADSSVAKMSVADRTGKFEFENISAGKYFVSITAIGHNKGFSA